MAKNWKVRGILAGIVSTLMLASYVYGGWESVLTGMCLFCVGGWLADVKQKEREVSEP